MPIIWGKVTALTSDPAYPAILFPGRSGPGRAYVSYAIPGNQFLHSPVTLRTRRYCFLAYSVLGELMLAMPFLEPVPALTSDLAYPAILFPRLFGPERGC